MNHPNDPATAYAAAIGRAHGINICTCNSQRCSACLNCSNVHCLCKPSSVYENQGIVPFPAMPQFPQHPPQYPPPQQHHQPHYPPQHYQQQYPQAPPQQPYGATAFNHGTPAAPEQFSPLIFQDKLGSYDEPELFPIGEGFGMGSLLRETVPEQAMEEEQPSFEMDQVVAVEELVDMYADENPSSGPVYPDSCLKCNNGADTGSTMITCALCKHSYHSRCVGIQSALLPRGNWYCKKCFPEGEHIFYPPCHPLSPIEKARVVQILRGQATRLSEELQIKYVEEFVSKFDTGSASRLFVHTDQ